MTLRHLGTLIYYGWVCQQLHIPPRSRGVDGNGLFGAKTLQIMRAAGFGAGAGEALTAEWLHTDDSADLVAVEVDVAHVRGTGQSLRSGIDAGLDA